MSFDGITVAINMDSSYSSIAESQKILGQICDQFLIDTDSLPVEIRQKRSNVHFKAEHDFPYFPIPLKETETAAALKAIEGSIVALLADIKNGSTATERQVDVDLEKTTAFLFQAYLATVGGLGKLDPAVKNLLKGTSFDNICHVCIKEWKPKK